MKRQIILDTETTGLSPKQGDRVIEIACLEMIDGVLTGEKFHTYLQPYRFVSPGAFRVHGITDEFLADKPRFKDIQYDFEHFLQDSQIIAHNASFDIGFLSHEFALVLLDGNIFPDVFCTKLYAQKLFGMGGNSLDQLCDRFCIDREKRELHSAMLDCELLFQVYNHLIGIGKGVINAS